MAGSDVSHDDARTLIMRSLACKLLVRFVALHSLRSSATGYETVRSQSNCTVRIGRQLQVELIFFRLSILFHAILLGRRTDASVRYRIVGCF